MSNTSIGADTVNPDEDEYYYDYNASISYIPIEKVVPISILYSLTFIIGCTGNFLVIFAISRYRRMKNITNTFLLSLASADMLLLVFCVPVKFADFLTFTWMYGEVLCKGVHYLMDVTAVCSVTTLTVMSLERYYAILHPIKAKYSCTVSRARKVTLGIWLASFVLASPTLFIRFLDPLKAKRGIFFWCNRSWGGRPLYHKLYEIYEFLIILLIPVVTMVYAYASICNELWAVSRQRSMMRQSEVIGTPDKSSCLLNHASLNHETSSYDIRVKGRGEVKKSTYSTEDDRTRKQVIKMLISIVVLFVICWSPIVINNMLVAFSVITLENHEYLLHMRQAFYLLAYSNSCVNPVVYGFMSKNFRETFKHALCRCIKGRNYARTMYPMRTATRTTLMSSTCNRSEIEHDDFELHVNPAVVCEEKLERDIVALGYDTDYDDGTLM